ncbi:MAG: type III secretion system export apparatus subunit SctS [Cocleimonas sp.]|nr:type III secretion system export apparatus subunit SctS [Cocleimonas sp.]
MSQEILVHLTSQAMELILYLSLPVLIAATVVGLIISLFQALTSIQEQTLPHAFKLVAVMLAIMFTVRWLGSELYDFTINIFNEFPRLPK